MTSVLSQPVISAQTRGDASYRYLLTLAWGERQRTLAWVLLHPSLTDDPVDDSTTRRVIEFSQRWGFDRAEIVNLFAFRAANADEVRTAVDPVGPQNRRFVHRVLANSDLVVVAWGDEARLAVEPPSTLEEIVRLRRANTATLCFGLTDTGQPVPPAAVDLSAVPVVWCVS